MLLILTQSILIMLAILLISAGLLCFAVFYYSVNYFEKI